MILSIKRFSAVNVRDFTPSVFSIKLNLTMAQRTLLHKFALLLLIALLADQLRGSEGFWRRNPRRKDFRKGKGSAVTIHRGDTVITHLIPNSKFVKPGPYRWHYAITPKVLIHLLPRFSKLMKSVRPTSVSIETLANKMIEDRGQKNPNATGMAGSLVGALMLEYGKQDKRIPFNFFRCNCHHYVEYLSLGKVKGSWTQPLYYPVNKKCAVYAPLTEDMAETIYNNKEFTLMDNKGGSYHLSVAKWPKYIEELYHGTQH